jgi:hypothetical protein
MSPSSLFLFPDFSLPSTLMVTVYVGVCVLAFFNLRWGWPLSGLVVPGFLSPILLARPVSALFLLVEALVTFALAKAVNVSLDKSSLAAPFFGRDRFFLIVLFSVVVRIFGEHIGVRYFQLPFSTWGLGSFGLVISALFANQMWKPGLWRGFGQSFFLVVVVFLFLNYVLVPYTNFNPARLSDLYAEIGSRLEDSPKSYIILLSTAFLASRWNLLYGWEFSGILIPALLALAWFEPLTLLVSVLEAGLVLIVARSLLRTRFFRSRSMEGARRVLFFFSVSFVLKTCLLWAFYFWAPQQQPSDFFGFGFLLSTLMALKAHEKPIFVRLVNSTLQTSLAGLALGLSASFALTLIPSGSASLPSWSFASKENSPEKDINPGLEELPVGGSGVERASPSLEGPFHEPTARASLLKYFSQTSGVYAEAFSEKYEPVSENFLVGFEAQVIHPLLNTLLAVESGEKEIGQMRAELERLSLVAQRFCYNVYNLPRSRNEQRFLASQSSPVPLPVPSAEREGVVMLMEDAGAPCARHQATLALRWSQKGDNSLESPPEPVVLLVPYPRAEEHIVEAAWDAFERLSARGLVLARAHPLSRADGAADVLSVAGRVSVYRLFSEKLLTRLAKYEENAESDALKKPLLALEMRGTSAEASELRVSSAHEEDTPFVKNVVEFWMPRVRAVDFAVTREAGLIANRTLASFAKSLNEVVVASVWLSPSLRERHVDSALPNSDEAEMFRSFGVSERTASLPDVLQASGVETAGMSLPEEWKNLWEKFESTGESSFLKAFLLRCEKSQLHVERLVDTRTRMTFLVIYNARGRVRSIAHLASHSPTSVQTLRTSDEITEAHLDAFAFSRMGWLEFTL